MSQTVRALCRRSHDNCASKFEPHPLCVLARCASPSSPLSVLQDLAPSLSVPLLDDLPPESMGSFVMCSNGGNSKVPIMAELKSLVDQIKDVTLGTESLAEAG